MNKNINLHNQKSATTCNKDAAQGLTALTMTKTMKTMMCTCMMMFSSTKEAIDD